jgi:hypothetical protein
MTPYFIIKYLHVLGASGLIGRFVTDDLRARAGQDRAGDCVDAGRVSDLG